jgi:hypothetical protein
MENGGGADSVLSNMISGNHSDGIIITGTTTMNTVANNAIQLNWGNGVHIFAAANNTIGGNLGANTIAWNSWDGVQLENGANLNNIAGNSLGTTGQGNGSCGVRIMIGSYQNTVQNNTIQSNSNTGVMIEDAGTYSNTVRANLIENSSNDGVIIGFGAHGNVIGGNSISDLNTIRGSGLQGIHVYQGAHNNSIINAVVNSNTKNGIQFVDAGTIDNTVFGSIVYSNGQDGINENSGADYNTWSTTLTYSNGGLGVDKNAPNDNQNIITPPFPTITSMQQVGGNVQFVGTASPAVGGVQSVSIEIYQAAVDPSGYGEGGQYVANATATAGGSWTRTVAGNLTGCYTAVQTMHFTNGHSTSSEYGPNQCPKLYLPLIMR